MSDRLDRVLRAIDSGLQSSGETGHTYDAGGCARCQQVMPVADDGDLCPGCKAFLLGDGPESSTASDPSDPSIFYSVGISLALATRQAMGAAYSLWHCDMPQGWLPHELWDRAVSPTTPNAETGPDVQ